MAEHESKICPNTQQPCEIRSALFILKSATEDQLTNASQQLDQAYGGAKELSASVEAQFRQSAAAADELDTAVGLTLEAEVLCAPNTCGAGQMLTQLVVQRA